MVLRHRPAQPYCVITTYGPEGPRVKQARLPSTPLALQQYFAQFPGPHQAVVESTGSWYWLADVLAALGVRRVLAPATRLKAISAAKVKTDQVDSDTMALRATATSSAPSATRPPAPCSTNPEIRAFLKAKARRKPIRIARTLVALELARSVYHVLTKQEAFNGQFKNQPQWS